MKFLSLKAILSLNGSGFQLGLKQAQSASKKFSSEIKSEFARAFGLAAITAYGAKVVNMADDLIDLSDRLGMSTKALQEWGYAAKKSGSNIEAVTRFLEQLTLARERALGGDADASAAFGKLGVSGGDLQSLSLNDIGRKIGDAVSEGNPAELLSSLREIGGKVAGELIPALKDMRELSKSAPIISDEDLERLKQAKNEAMALVDVFQGPMADFINWMAEALTNGFTMIKAGIAAMAAFAGGMTPGNSFMENMRTGAAAANTAFDEVFSEWEARRKRVTGQSQTRQDTTDKPPPEQDVLHNVPTGTKKAVEAAARASIDRPQLNAWQQLGAAVRFSPENHGREIAKNTQDTVKELGALKEAVNRSTKGNGENPYE